MKCAIRWFNLVLFVLAVLIAGCSQSGSVSQPTTNSQPGSKYLGTWVNTADSKDNLRITSQGEQFVVASGPDQIRATYKNGWLVFSGEVSAMIAYDEATDQILAPAHLVDGALHGTPSGFFTQARYRREK